jgi:hypothetical protein
MHVLLIGLGNMGKKYLSKLEEMGKLPVLCDRDPNKAVGSYPFYCHFEEVQEPTKAVIIAVDPAEHVKLAKFFLEDGASVLLEKPPALSKREFMEIYHHPTLYISEIESFSSCLDYFPKDVEEVRIERLGKRERLPFSPLGFGMARPLPSSAVFQGSADHIPQGGRCLAFGGKSRRRALFYKNRLGTSQPFKKMVHKPR